MTETKFTPGPWMAWQPRGDESVPVRTDGLGITIAYVHQGAITNAQANAHLIAAAPELYEKLAKIRGWTNIDAEGAWGKRFYAEVDALLAKARGEA
ncbi:hypothetical protein FHS76_004244 [Ochrobactrum daejeonense]|uniref:Uncharacterized protein n=1 Tax=Brucella daejeonensis TaxID=659015 RepID=A0A7W9B164_9HYPH|nr:hypothetical protein [Brucella daejeonensis]MBB5704327.1 hypothetical protein [Brucella daejeonensis]